MTQLVGFRVGSGARAGVATLTLDSPANRNALSLRLMAELRDGLQTALDDATVRVIVISHTGPSFCSGADLKEAGDPGTARALPTALPALLDALWHSPKPIVARVAGPARAGGIGLLAACDLVVCSTAATFAFTEVRLGLVPAVISATVLPRLQRPAAHELFLTGQSFDAQRAVEIGLVTTTASPEVLDIGVQDYVDLLLRGAPGALAATKALLRRPVTPGVADLAELSTLSAEHFAGAEGQEGIAASAAKRDPSWITPQ